MITKLRKLNALLAELGEKNLTLTVDHQLPNTRSVIASMVPLTSHDIDISYEPHNPLVIEFVAYIPKLKVWSQTTVADNEFASATMGGNRAKTAPDTKGGTINVTEEFVDKAITLLEPKVREKIKEEIIKELVDVRLKERHLV